MTAFAVLAAISVAHLLNDTIQSLLPAIYPLLKTSFNLSFAQIGMMTLALMLTASVLQPVVGHYTDRVRRRTRCSSGWRSPSPGCSCWPWRIPTGCCSPRPGWSGSVRPCFTPSRRASREWHRAAGMGSRKSLFQVGGNVGSSVGPLVAAFIVAPFGQRALAWCSVIAIAGMLVVSRVDGGTGITPGSRGRAHRRPNQPRTSTLSRSRIGWTLAVLAALIFSKYFYLASLSSYYTFYLITKFDLSVRAAQVHLFIFLASVAAAPFSAGQSAIASDASASSGDSILGVLPFTLALPYASLFWTTILTIVIGLTLASAFSAIVVYAQELVPGRVGLISGVFFGFAFGMGGLGAAALGELADAIGIESVYRICAFLPAIGLLTAFLPDVDSPAARARQARAESAPA
jgi:FSR family fosmidomycin resistance protein-like MFS transporter